MYGTLKEFPFSPSIMGYLFVKKNSIKTTVLFKGKTIFPREDYFKSGFQASLNPIFFKPFSWMHPTGGKEADSWIFSNESYLVAPLFLEWNNSFLC